MTGLISAGAMLLLVHPVAIYLLHNPELYPLVGLYVLALPFRMLANGSSRTLLWMYDRFDLLSIKSVAYGLARLIFIRGAAVVGMGLQGILIGIVVAEAIGAIMLLALEWMVLKRRLPEIPLVDFHKPKQFREGLSMMGGLWLSATLWGLEVEM